MLLQIALLDANCFFKHFVLFTLCTVFGLSPARYAARFDCGNVYQIEVVLQKTKDGEDQGDILDTFKFEEQTPQWAPNDWKEVLRRVHHYCTVVILIFLMVPQWVVLQSQVDFDCLNDL